MEFSEFAARAREIESTAADLGTVSLVAALLHDANSDLPVLARFVQGRVFPAHDSTTLDIGPSHCYGALARAAGPNVTAEDVEDRLAEVGEIGEVAASYDLGGQRGLAAFSSGGTEPLTVTEVDETLRAVAAASGPGSEDRKSDLLFGLFNRSSSEEARYLARLVLSEMRIGVGEGTVRDAITEAFDVPTETVERAVQLSNDYGLVAELARDGGAEGLAGVSLEIGRPVQAMLAQTGTVTDVLEEWGTAAVEWKYDGARVQLHHDPAGEVRVFSRNMEEVTDALPEVIEFAEERLDVPLILDGEVIAVDGNGDPLPFQEVLRRFRRKHDVEATRETVAVRPVFFDCLHADGEDLLDRPFTERHERLVDRLDSGDGTANGLSKSWFTDDPEEIAAIEAESLEAGHEGLMLKRPGSAYSPGKRGRNWRKRKPDVETLDLVVTGAEWGEGRRAQFFGTFLLSVWNDGEFETIGKVATGVSDEKLADLTDLLEDHVLAEDGQAVEFRPEVVFEVGYEEIQRSPTYESGYALRFPRFLAVRSDKPVEEAASLATVQRLRDEQQ